MLLTKISFTLLFLFFFHFSLLFYTQLVLLSHGTGKGTVVLPLLPAGLCSNTARGGEESRVLLGRRIYYNVKTHVVTCMKPKNAKQGNLFPIFSTDLLCGLQGAKSLLPEPLRSVEKTKSGEQSTQMDGITLSSFGSWAFLVGRGPSSSSRLVAMLVSHGP